MPSSRTRQIWDSGFALNDAWYELASDEEQQAHDALPGFLDMQPTENDGAGLLTFLTSASEAVLSKRKNEDRLKDDLLESLFNNDFIATGYVRSSAPRPKPIIIPASTFAGNEAVDWKKSTISNLGVIYENVRIADFDPVAAKQSKRIGRPGSGDAINAAIDKLMNCDPKFCADNRNVACAKIRKHLGQQSTNQNGFSDINLAKYIRRKCPKRIIKIEK